MASWARRNLAAATSFMERVIFCVDLTDAIRIRTAFRDGISRARLLRGLGLHVGRELLAEVAQYLAQQGDQIAVPGLAVVALGAQLAPHRRVLAVDERIQLAL